MALTQGHKLDANTVALWRMDEASAAAAFVDATGVYNVPVSTGSFVPAAGRVDGARTFGTGNYASTAAITDNVVVPILQSGNFTWENWFWLDPSVGTDFNGKNGTVVCYNGTLIGFLAGFATGGSLRYFNATGGPIVAGNWSNLSRSTWHHYAIRSTSSDATHATIDFFVDGVKAASVANVLKFTGAPTGQVWALGQENFDYFIGRVDDSRFSKIARTDAEIADSYWRGIVPLNPGPNTFPPLAETISTDFQQYQLALSPTALLDPTGTLFEAAFASQKDLFSDKVRLSLKARLPQLAPPDALTQIGIERGMPQGQSESGVAYGSRLQDAWNAWPWAGTAFGLLRAFYATGYSNVVLAQPNGGQLFTLDNGGTNLALWSQDFTRAVWTKDASATLTPNFAVAPDGTTTATKIALTGALAADGNIIYQRCVPLTSSGVSYTESLWIRADAPLTLRLGSGFGVSLPINVGTGWARFPKTAIGDGINPAYINLKADSLGQTGPIYVWGGQFESAAAAGPYSRTFAVAKTTALAAGSLLTAAEGNGIWETDPLSTYVAPLRQSFWSKFDVIFPLPLMPPNWGWAGGIPAANSAEANFIRALISQWKPGHATANRIVIVQQGSVWGYPASGTWGEAGDTWGGDTNTVWTP